MILPLLAGVAAAVAAGYNSMAPRAQLYGRTFIGEQAGSRRLALTFDDGPNDPHTLELLEVLARHNVRATFFMLGRFVCERPHIARAVAQAGHVIGNHSYAHRNLIFRSRPEVQREIAACRAALDEVIGPTAPLFRPPFGGRTPAVLRTAGGMGYAPVMWSVTGWDWNPTSAEKIEKIVRRQVRGGDVILLHDGGHQRLGADRSHTVRATDLIVRRYRDEGYTFVTVPEMMNPSPEKT